MDLADKGSERRRAWPLRGGLLLVVAALALVVAGCARGTYAVELFPEMHYQQSARMQEPPRLAPPAGAVPITGREVDWDFARASELINPLPRTAQVLATGAELFRVNCSMCHGPEARGDGPVATYLVRDGYSRPPDLLASVTQEKSDGHLFWLVSNGVVVMPRFKFLIEEDARWALVLYLRELAKSEERQ